MRPIMLRQYIGHTGAERDLNPLNSIQDEQSKFTIEYVKIKNVVETNTLIKLVIRIAFLEGKRVGAKPIVADDVEVVFC